MKHSFGGKRVRAWLMPAALFAAILGGGAAQAADDAEAILKKMSDYVSSQKTLSIAYDTDIEVIMRYLAGILAAAALWVSFAPRLTAQGLPV